MTDLSLGEKTKALSNVITSSPLFLFCAMLLVALLIFFVICVQKNIKINKWMFIMSWAFLLIVVLIKYNSVVLNLIDNLFDTIFMALYFPNLTFYLLTLVVSNGYLVYSIFSKKLVKSQKIINVFSAIIIDVLLIFIMDLVKSNGINVYEELTVFSNKDLLILLQFNSAIFTSWILLSLLASAHKKLKRFDKKELPKMQEIVFD